MGNTTLLEQWMIKYSAPADITMVGVWDTVGALRGQKGYLETGLRTPLKHAFHALAIDEHRKKFTPTLYTINHYLDRPPSAHPNRTMSQVEQRWFVGSHANLGGGYNSDLLPQPPLWWLMRKASALNLSFREALEHDDLLYKAKIRDSFEEFAYGAYRVAMRFKPYYRPIGADPMIINNVKTFNVNETIDASVFERWRRDSLYRPYNLLDWAERHGKLDPAKLTTSVNAAYPGETLSD